MNEWINSLGGIGEEEQSTDSYLEIDPERLLAGSNSEYNQEQQETDSTREFDPDPIVQSNFSKRLSGI